MDRPYSFSRSNHTAAFKAQDRGTLFRDAAFIRSTVKRNCARKFYLSSAGSSSQRLTALAPLRWYEAARLPATGKLLNEDVGRLHRAILEHPGAPRSSRNRPAFWARRSSWEKATFETKSPSAPRSPPRSAAAAFCWQLSTLVSTFAAWQKWKTTALIEHWKQGRSSRLSRGSSSQK